MVYEHSKKFIKSIFLTSLPEEVCSLIYYFARSKLSKNTNIYRKLKYKNNRKDKTFIEFYKSNENIEFMN